MRGRYVDFVDDEAGIRHHRLVSRLEKCPGEQGDDFIGAVTQDNLVGRDLPAFGQSLSEIMSSAVRIAVKGLGGGV